MPTKIRKSALESTVEAIVRTQRRSRIGLRNINIAIDLIDARISNPNDQLKLSDSARSNLANAVMGILNNTTVHDNLPTIQAARALLVGFSGAANPALSVVASEEAGSELLATVTAKQSDSFTYLWTVEDGPSAVTFTPSATDASPVVSGWTPGGTYTFKVVVTDSIGNTAEDTVIVNFPGE